MKNKRKDNPLNDPVIRKEVAKRDFFWFFNLYFLHHIRYSFADMHKEMFDICQNNNITLALIMAFRGSGKSTLISTAFPLWSILGIHKRKYVVIITKTRHQAKQIMMNIKTELEDNNELSKDLGPFKEIGKDKNKQEWNSESIVFTRCNARITVVSIEQSLKGLRHKQYRPDLIILDDVEDNDSTKTREMREKTYEKYKRDVVPLGDIGTRIIHVGNMLHDDSLIMRLSREIEEKDTTKIVKRYPIIDEDNNIFWPAKFPTLADVEKEKLKINDETAWYLEYLLKSIPNQGQIFSKDEIQYYDQIPPRNRHEDPYYNARHLIIGIDLAISQKDSADYTVFCPVLFQRVAKYKYEIYILPEIHIERMNVSKICDLIILLNKSLNVYSVDSIEFLIEDVGFQSAISQMVRSMDPEHYVEIIDRKITTDKESRLRLCKSYFSSKSIFFPRNSKNGDILIQELLGFGRERHDDAADALSLALNYITEKYLVEAVVFIV